MSVIFPNGTSPSFIRAWKPLQIPAISPSRSFRSFSVSSLTSALRKNAVMSLPLPSGSSEPEKPPGMNIICAVLSDEANCSALRLIISPLRFFITIISGSAPASAITFAVSYSQFVPGNAGMRTFGFAVFIAGTG